MDEATLKTILDAMNTELQRILAIDWLGQILLSAVRILGNGTFWCKVTVWGQYMGRMLQRPSLMQRPLASALMNHPPLHTLTINGQNKAAKMNKEVTMKK